MARKLTSMVKAKTKTCVHCGHTFDLNNPRRDLSDQDWLPAASVYCSHECSNQFHCNLAHCCSTHVKAKAQRKAAKAAQRYVKRRPLTSSWLKPVDSSPSMLRSQ